MGAEYLNVLVLAISGIIVPVTLFMWNRLTKRLDSIDKVLGKHTKALTKFAGSLKTIQKSDITTMRDIEELQDAVDQLQLSTGLLKQAQQEHMEYHKGLRQKEIQ